jgi:uncharacterized paraquat-inducible protein A
MKLSDEELVEIRGLSRMCQTTSPLSKEMEDRYRYLRKKKIHNCCSNPKCTGYEGTEKEMVCPRCKSKLFKTLPIKQQ